MQKKPGSFWIIGAGEFGRKAVRKLRKKYPEACLTVVDHDPQALIGLEDSAIDRICMEGASYVASHLNDRNEPDWIIPAVPIHLAFEWVIRRLAPDARIQTESVPEAIAEMLPNPKRGEQGQLYISYADFRCPDHCTEPYDLCTWTGKPRNGLLYKKIEEISYKDYKSIVVQSRQLAGGVGGYQPKALRNSLSAVLETTTAFLYSTACFCHGVMHAFRIVERFKTGSAYSSNT